MYIAAFESLKASIIVRIRDFFCSELDVERGKVSPKYQSDVLSRNSSLIYASLDWLKSMGAIATPDLDAFDRAKAYRNTLAHELLSSLSSESMETDLGERFGEMLSLLRKIEVWWILNVEIATNPDMADREVSECDIQPGPCIAMQLLCEMALLNIEDSRTKFEQIMRAFDARSRPS